MSDDRSQKTDAAPQRHVSTSGGKDYYPSIDELLAADSDGFKKLTGKLNKEWILCLLRDSLGHLKQAKLTSDHFANLETKVDVLVSKSDNQGTSSMPQNRIVSDVIKTSLDERDYDQRAQKTVLFYNLDEKEDTPENTENTVHNIFAKMNQPTGCIKSAYRLGKRNSGSARPRPIEVELSHEFDKRKLMASVGQLKGTKIFVKPKLLWRERILEKSLLNLRYHLIQNGFDKQLFRIRDLKLFYNAQKIDSSKPIQEIINFLSTLSQSDQ